MRSRKGPPLFIAVPTCLPEYHSGKSELLGSKLARALAKAKQGSSVDHCILKVDPAVWLFPPLAVQNDQSSCQVASA